MADTENPKQTPAPEGGESFTPITSQEDLNRVLAARLEREREKFSDYEDLRAKAEKFDAAEDAAKTELQRATERAEAAEKERDQARADAMRESVAREKGVPVDVLQGSSKEDLEASADALLAWRGEARRSGSLNPNGGFFSGASAGAATADDPKARAAAAMRRLGRNT